MILSRNINVTGFQVTQGHYVTGNLRAQVNHIFSEVLIVVLEKKTTTITYSLLWLQKEYFEI